MAVIYPKSYVETLCAEIDDQFGYVGNTLKHHQLLEKVPSRAMLIFPPQFRTNISLFESVIR